MLVWAALTTISLDVNLHASLLVISALGTMHAMNGKIAVFLAGLEFESSLLARFPDRHLHFLAIIILVTTAATWFNLRIRQIFLECLGLKNIKKHDAEGENNITDLQA
jgi:hypothetical protein